MENGEDNQDGQNEEPSPFVPDLGLPHDESVNHGQGNGGAAAGGAVGGGGGEAPLSFRRFLEPAGPVSLGRPDVAAGLPDFVQDHLAPAAAVGAARDWQPPAAVAGAVGGASGTRRKVPSSAASAAGGAAPLPAGQPLGLPDFLSDGPMGTLHAAGADGPGRDPADAVVGGARLRSPPEATQQRLQRLELENASLRRDVERLQQQLQQERTRTSMLQSQLSSAEAAAAAAAAAAGAAASPPPADARLQEEVRVLSAQNAELRRRAAAEPSVQQAAAQIEQAAAGTEQLISQLTAGLRHLRSISAGLGAAAAGDVRPEPLPDLGRPPSGEPC